MANIQKLKNEARRAEQRSDWARAIELYGEAIRLDESGQGMVDLSLYNRIGDLYLRQGDTATAVSYYESAVDRYAGQDLHTSAIALCNKILRIAPGRTGIYRKLGRLHAQTGLLAESKSNFLEFAQRMQNQGQLGEALEALQEFVNLSSDEEIRRAFAEKLIERDMAAEAVAQLRLVWEDRVRRGSDAGEIRARILEIAPGSDPLGEGAPPPAPDAAGQGAAPAPAVASAASGSETVNLGSLLGVETDVLPGGSGGPPAGGDVGSTPPAAGPDREVDEDIRELLEQFRREVDAVLEDSDYAVHYDLGVAYRQMGLIDEAIAEFQIAVQSPNLLAAATEMLTTCLREKDGGTETDAPAATEVELERPTDFQSVSLGDEVERPAEAGPGPQVEPAGSALADDLSLEALETGIEPEPLPEMEIEPQAEEEIEPQAEPEASGEGVVGPPSGAPALPELDSEGHYDMGLAYQETGQLNEAVAEFRAALHGPPVVETRALDALAVLAKEQGTPSELRLSLLHLLHERGRSGEALEGYLALLGSREEAGEDVSEIRELIAQIDPSALPPERDLEVEPGAEVEPEAELEPEPEDPAAELDAEIRELEREVEDLERRKQFRPAADVMDRLLELRPDNVELHQRRVEYAMLTNDRAGLLRALLGLGRCLQEKDARRSARSVYGRVLDVEPDNEEATAAIAALDELEIRDEEERTEGSREAGADGPEADDAWGDEAPEFLDLGQALRDELGDEAVTDFEFSEPTLGDIGEEDFEGMLRAFRTKVSATLGESDYESHYELGLALRQMDMLDEAIRELQVAVRGMENPLPGYEALGDCFIAREDYAVAVRVLSRVESRSDHEDGELVGILYSLGVAEQALGHPDAAIEYFERVIAVDLDFRDAGERIQALAL